MAKLSTNKSLIQAETLYILEVIRHAIAYNDKNPKTEDGKPYTSIYAALHKESVDNVSAMGIGFFKKKATHHSFFLPKKGTKAYNALMDGSDVVERAAKEKEVKAAALKAAKAEKAAKDKERAEKKKAKDAAEKAAAKAKAEKAKTEKAKTEKVAAPAKVVKVETPAEKPATPAAKQSKVKAAAKVKAKAEKAEKPATEKAAKKSKKK